MTIAKRYVSNSHCIYNIGYHIIWCPKYRRKVLTGEIEVRLKELLLAKAAGLDIEIKTMEVMPDHVHLFIKSRPTYAVHFVIQQFKGCTSKTLRDEFPILKTRLPTLWTRSYFCESVGQISQETIEKYIQNQKKI